MKPGEFVGRILCRLGIWHRGHSTGERWFDGDYSENYLGFGHQNKREFAAWATREDGGQSEPYAPADVEHLWALELAGDRLRLERDPEPGMVPFTRLKT